jgi:hypothetical protein
MERSRNGFRGAKAHGVALNMNGKATESGLEGVYTLEDVSSPIDPAKCLYCGLEILLKRKGKKFCNKKHRWLFHNLSQKNQLRAFAQDMLASLKRHGLIDEGVTLK